jgi:hypothetical protein
VTQCGNECPMFTLDPSRTSKRHNRPLVARTSGITGAAQRLALELPTCAACFDKKASDRQVTARLTSAQTGPVTVLYGRSGCHIQAMARRSGDCAQALHPPDPISKSVHTGPADGNESTLICVKPLARQSRRTLISVRTTLGWPSSLMWREWASGL